MKFHFILMALAMAACGLTESEKNRTSTASSVDSGGFNLDPDYPGKCKLSAAGFRTKEGGCFSLDTNYSFSMARNGYNLAQAEAYCTGLVEGGFDDWVIPTAAVLKALKLGENWIEVGEFIHGLSYNSADGRLLPINFWMAFGFMGSAGYSPPVGAKPDPAISASVICARRVAAAADAPVERIIGFADETEAGLILTGMHLMTNATAIESPFYISGNAQALQRTESGAGIYKGLPQFTTNFRIKIPFGTKMENLDGTTEELAAGNVRGYSGRKVVVNSRNTANSYTDASNDGRFIISVSVHSAARGGCYLETNYFKTTEFGCTDQKSGLHWYTFAGDAYDGDGFFKNPGEARTLADGDFDLHAPSSPKKSSLDPFGRLVKLPNNIDVSLGRSANARAYPETDLLGVSHDVRALQLAQQEASAFYVRNRAQKLCDDLNAFHANGINDWRLPSVDELKKLHSTARPSLLTEAFFGNVQLTNTITSSAGNAQSGSMVVNIGTEEAIGPFNKNTNCVDSLAEARQDECFIGGTTSAQTPVACDVIAAKTCFADAATTQAAAKANTSYTLCVSSSQAQLNAALTRPVGLVEGMFLDVTGRRPSAAEATPANTANLGTALSDSMRGSKFTTLHLYRTYLGREAEKTGLRYWADKIFKKVLTPEVVAGSMFGSGEYFKLAGGSNQSFVNALYFDILQRQADAGGLAFWLDKLQTISRTNVAIGFTQSQEFKTKLVADLFIRMLKRYPSSGEINQYRDVPYSSLVKAITGLTEYRDNLARPFDANMPGSTWVRKMFPRLANRRPSTTEIITYTRRLYEGRSPRQVANEIVLATDAGGVRIINDLYSKFGINSGATFAARERFRAYTSNLVGQFNSGNVGNIENFMLLEAGRELGTALSNAAWVEAAYQAIVGRAPTAAELQTHTGVLNNGVARFGVAKTIVQKAEVPINYLNAAFVRIYQRQPSSFEYAYWVDQIRRNRRPFDEMEAMMAADTLHWQ